MNWAFSASRSTFKHSWLWQTRIWRNLVSPLLELAGKCCSPSQVQMGQNVKTSWSPLKVFGCVIFPSFAVIFSKRSRSVDWYMTYNLCYQNSDSERERRGRLFAPGRNQHQRHIPPTWAQCFFSSCSSCHRLPADTERVLGLVLMWKLLVLHFITSLYFGHILIWSCEAAQMIHGFLPGLV